VQFIRAIFKEQMEKMNAQFRELASAMSQPSTVDLKK
jgi:hypothetical protein